MNAGGRCYVTVCLYNGQLFGFRQSKDEKRVFQADWNDSLCRTLFTTSSHGRCRSVTSGVFGKVAIHCDVIEEFSRMTFSGFLKNKSYVENRIHNFGEYARTTIER